jgi:hypothetical protein
VGPGCGEDNAVGHWYLEIHTDAGGIEGKALVQVNDSPLLHGSDSLQRLPFFSLLEPALECLLNRHGRHDQSLELFNRWRKKGMRWVR